MEDIVINGSSSNLVIQYVDVLKKRFDIKVLGALNYFLRLQVTYDSSGLHVYQLKYALIFVQSLIWFSVSQPLP